MVRFFLLLVVVGFFCSFFFLFCDVLFYVKIGLCSWSGEDTPPSFLYWGSKPSCWLALEGIGPLCWVALGVGPRFWLVLGLRALLLACPGAGPQCVIWSLAYLSILLPSHPSEAELSYWLSKLSWTGKLLHHSKIHSEELLQGCLDGNLEGLRWVSCFTLPSWHQKCSLVFWISFFVPFQKKKDFSHSLHYPSSFYVYSRPSLSDSWPL